MTRGPQTEQLCLPRIDGRRDDEITTASYRIFELQDKGGGMGGKEGGGEPSDQQPEEGCHCKPKGWVNWS